MPGIHSPAVASYNHCGAKKEGVHGLYAIDAIFVY